MLPAYNDLLILTLLTHADVCNNVLIAIHQPQLFQDSPFWNFLPKKWKGKVKQIHILKLCFQGDGKIAVETS